MYYTHISYIPTYKLVITFISMDMISDNELLDKDTSDDIAIVKNKPQEDSP